MGTSFGRYMMMPSWWHIEVSLEQSLELTNMLKAHVGNQIWDTCPRWIGQWLTVPHVVFVNGLVGNNISETALAGLGKPINEDSIRHSIAWRVVRSLPWINMLWVRQAILHAMTLHSCGEFDRHVILIIVRPRPVKRALNCAISGPT